MLVVNGSKRNTETAISFPILHLQFCAFFLLQSLSICRKLFVLIMYLMLFCRMDCLKLSLLYYILYYIQFVCVWYYLRFSLEISINCYRFCFCEMLRFLCHVFIPNILFVTNNHILIGFSRFVWYFNLLCNDMTEEEKKKRFSIVKWY